MSRASCHPAHSTGRSRGLAVTAQDRVTAPDGSVTRMLRALTPYGRQTAGLLAAGSAASILSNTAVVLPAILLGRALDAVVGWQAGRITPEAAGRAVALWSAGIALVEGPRIVRRWLLGSANNRIRTQLRADAMRGVMGWPLARMHGAATGDLMARIIGDVEVVGTGVKTLTTDTWDTLYSACVTLAALLAYNPGLTALALAPVPAAMLLAHATRRWVGGRTTASREANAALTGALQEQLAGARLLRLFGRTQGAVARTHALADRLAQANIAVVRLREGLAPVYGVLMTAGVVVVIWRGGRDVTAGAMTVGAFVAYLELFLRFATRGHRVPRFLNRLQSAAAAWERLEPLLAIRPLLRGGAEQRPERPEGVEGLEPLLARSQPMHAMVLRATFEPGRIEEPGEPAEHPAARHGPVGVTIHDIAFRYPGAARLALEHVSLDLAPGTFVAITGPVGSGKSALARALLGLYPLESGEILWDDTPVGRIPGPVRAARCGYLPQDAGLFAGTVRENIRMAWPAGDGDVTPFAARAALTDDLAGFPHGLDTQIGETGIRISGGQRQRVALARALAVALPGSPGLLVLDDPFSAVDPDTEARIVRTLVEHHGRSAPPGRRVTLVLLSHRLAAFPLADRVLLLGEGTVAETGTHQDLMRAGGLYARIFAAQTRAGRGGRA